MKILRNIALAAISLAALAFTACDDTKSYAELLTDETHYVNAYLANQRVVASIPADTVFETGPDAPYYRLDEDGNLYMQVLDATATISCRAPASGVPAYSIRWRCCLSTARSTSSSSRSSASPTKSPKWCPISTTSATIVPKSDDAGADATCRVPATHPIIFPKSFIIKT